MVDLKIKVPPSFLCEEERCGVKVSKQMKEIWAVQLDLLYRLNEVCKENGLSFFAGAGTLLGAVRHQGFIPWDDDMDFYLLREDYDRLMQMADRFEPPYFLQNAYTDPNLMTTYAKLRNSKTTYYTEFEAEYNINKGICIDIFPLDGVNENSYLNRLQKVKDLYYQLFFKDTHHNYTGLSRKKRIKRHLANIVISMNLARKDNKYDYYKKYETNLKKYSLPTTKIWGNRTLVFDCPKSRRPIEDWKNIIEVPFEFTSIPIPTNYDAILRQQYGDYMKIPDEKHRVSMHHTLYISTDYAYDDPRRIIE